MLWGQWPMSAASSWIYGSDDPAWRAQESWECFLKNELILKSGWKEKIFTKKTKNRNCWNNNNMTQYPGEGGFESE